ncbi:MAG: acetyl-CoA acetyltransferase [Planctomycetota bacterium]
MSGRVAIVGAGCTAFGEHFDRSYTDLAAEAAQEALREAGVPAKSIGAAWLSTAFPDVGVYRGRSGMDLAESLGVSGIPITRVSNYCASGGDALRNAANALLAGECDVALAVGVEKQRDRPPQESIVKMMVEAGHPSYQKGFTAAGTFAVFAVRHMEVHGLTRQDIAAVSVKNHAHGVENAKAHHRKPVTAEQVLSSPQVAWPLTLLDCCPTTDGAAAVVLVREDDASKYRSRVLVAGIGFSVTSGWDAPFHDEKFDFLGFPAVRDAARRAYAQAGISEPSKDLHLVEVHDCFSVNELIAYEDLGLCPPGGSAGLLRDGVTRLGGRLPVNPSGGLLSCGHPVGATALRMVYEAVRQIQGAAGKRQVPGARQAATQNIGGPGAVAFVSVLRAM